MSHLEECRSQIDELDEKFAALFEERFRIVKEIIDYKVENRLPILDEGRENEIIKKNTDRIEDEDLRRYFRAVYQYMIEVSREYQEEVLSEK